MESRHDSNLWRVSSFPLFFILFFLASFSFSALFLLCPQMTACVCVCGCVFGCCRCVGKYVLSALVFACTLVAPTTPPCPSNPSQLLWHFSTLFSVIVVGRDFHLVRQVLQLVNLTLMPGLTIEIFVWFSPAHKHTLSHTPIQCSLFSFAVYFFVLRVFAFPFILLLRLTCVLNYMVYGLRQFQRCVC